MIKVKKFTCNMLQENCYVASDETNECIIIDCGAFYPEDQEAIVNYIAENNLKPIHLLCTHAHIDHNFGNDFVFEKYGLKPQLHIKDKFLMEKLPEQAQSLLGITIEKPESNVENYLSESDTISFGNQVFKIIETPGHTPGSVFFYNEKERIAFSGDTVFHYSIGRTDLEGGSTFQMIQTLRFISQLPDDVTLYPGHGDYTTIGAEVEGNPYMDR